jgi:hypothetical protein
MLQLRCRITDTCSYHVLRQFVTAAAESDMRVGKTINWPVAKLCLCPWSSDASTCCPCLAAQKITLSRDIQLIGYFINLEEYMVLNMKVGNGKVGRMEN